LSPQLEVFKGTLDLMVLRTLEAMGAMHGFGIARRIEQVSGESILLNQGTIYASLVRLQQRGLIRGEWAFRTTTERRNSIPSPSGGPSGWWRRRRIGMRWRR
jgi:PadR family transcriptional regulator, regulatory protein PadR